MNNTVYLLGLLLREKQKYPGTAFGIEVLRVLHSFTPSFSTLVAVLKSGISSNCQNFFRVAQIDLELHILCRTAR